jgi:hypothetical protein
MAGGTRWNPRNPPRTGNGAVPSRRAKPTGVHPERASGDDKGHCAACGRQWAGAQAALYGTPIPRRRVAYRSTGPLF